MKATGKNRLGAAAGKVQHKSAKNAVSEENQNQGHNTQKEALGPNTRR